MVNTALDAGATVYSEAESATEAVVLVDAPAVDSLPPAAAAIVELVALGSTPPQPASSVVRIEISRIRPKPAPTTSNFIR
jgi:hypothetical protein